MSKLQYQPIFLTEIPKRQDCSYLAEEKLFCLTVSYWDQFGTEHVTPFDITETDIGRAIDKVGAYCQELMEEWKKDDDGRIRWEAYEITSVVMIRRGE